jgi:hypothetical protein
MKVFLMHRDMDFQGNAPLPPDASDLVKDLELDTLFRGMAAGDEFLLDVAKKAVLASLRQPEEIAYRQNILTDCLQRPECVKEIYQIAVEAIERERKVWGWTSELPQSTLYRAIEVLQIFLGLLKKLRRIADQHPGDFRSEGFRRFFGMLAAELNDEYLSVVEGHLRRLEFPTGLLMSAQLGQGLKGWNYILRKPADPKLTWMGRVQGWLGLAGKDHFVYEIADRDESGFQALSELRNQGIGHVAAALAQSTDHILSFFSMLRTELGFYVGCLNLRERLNQKGEPVCIPEPVAGGKPTLSARGVYDICLSLSIDSRTIGNEVAGDEKTLILITGANRGGKSTFLRSIGLAQLMMQCGMFVAADAFRANICSGIFTHFKREEDTTMKSGKLDEELRRMSSIVDHIFPNSVVLLNESFASTNEREGSEIARQIVDALLESGIKVFYVTHMFDLAQSFYGANMDVALFLRAERLPDGRRTFRIIEGRPFPTSHGADLYQRIFADVSKTTVAESEPSAYEV